MRFIVLTGASASGKTTIAEAIASRYGEYVDVYHSTEQVCRLRTLASQKRPRSGIPRSLGVGRILVGV